MKKIKILVLLILPIVLFYIGMLYKSEVGLYHLFITDPEYAYLLNGLNILHFYPPYQVNGPGTPLQFFCALITGIVHLFRNQDTLMVDVIKNPDIYLEIINTSLIATSAIALFAIGYTIFLASKSVFTGAFFQLMPFVSWQLIDILKHIMVENFVVIGVIVLIAVVFIYIYNPGETYKDKFIDKYVIWFSVIIGFITANKLMYLPIAIIPFLLLEGYKRKITFTLLSAVTFSVFSFPIFIYWVSFRDWYLNNLIHSGFYGSGATTFIDIASFRSNIRSVFYSDHFYHKAFAVVFLGSIIYHLPFLKRKIKNDNTYKALLGVLITMIIMSILVAKQFKYYYMSTALLLSIPGLYFVFSIYTRGFSKKVKMITSIPLFIFIAYNAYQETRVMFDVHQANVRKKELYLNTKAYIENNYPKDQPTLLIADYYGAPYTAYGLFYGMAWCGPRMGSKYAVALNKYYPNIYIYHAWNNLFNQWGNSYSFIDLLKRYKSIVLYVGDLEKEKLLQTKLHGLNRQIDMKFTHVKTFQETNEKIYEVKYDSLYSKIPLKLYFNLENTDSIGESFISSTNIKIGGGNSKSSDFARSGIYSSKLTVTDSIGLVGFLSEVAAGEHYIINVWRYMNENKNAGIAISANNQEKLYLFASEPKTSEKNWQQIEIDFIVPEKANQEDLKIYCSNNDPVIPAYFDDLTIEKIVP